jgi:hypothetical protein
MVHVEDQMAGRSTAAALQRAWQRPKVRAQTERAARAYTAANRARMARRRTIALADQRVDDRDDAACIETARLVWTCGSAEIAAALLGLDPERLRRAMNCVERVLGTPRPAQPDVATRGPCDGRCAAAAFGAAFGASFGASGRTLDDGATPNLIPGWSARGSRPSRSRPAVSSS